MFCVQLIILPLVLWCAVNQTYVFNLISYSPASILRRKSVSSSSPLFWREMISLRDMQSVTLSGFIIWYVHLTARLCTFSIALIKQTLWSDHTGVAYSKIGHTMVLYAIILAKLRRVKPRGLCLGLPAHKSTFSIFSHKKSHLHFFSLKRGCNCVTVLRCVLDNIRVP